MAVELNIVVDYSGSGYKDIKFSDIRDVYKEVVAKAEEARIDPLFFKKIVQRMPSIAKMGIERITSKFAHYLENYDSEGGEIRIWMKEIASMDPSLERRIVKKTEEQLEHFGGLVGAQTITTGRDRDKNWVVKLAYKTQYMPDEMSVNEYDEETGIRVTYSSPFSSKDEAMNHGMWLAGVLNVRHIDEDELPK